MVVAAVLFDVVIRDSICSGVDLMMVTVMRTFRGRNTVNGNGDCNKGDRNADNNDSSFW